MNHFMTHNILKLLFRKVIIVCHGYCRIIECFVKPTTLGVLEIATRPKGMKQVKLRK